MRLISTVMICSLLYSVTACYSSRLILQKDEILKEVNTGNVVFVRTDAHAYDLHPPYYYEVIQDTLIGQGRNMIYQEGFIRKEDFKIAVKDIQELEVQNLKKAETVFLIIGSAILISGMVIINSLSNI